MAVVTNNSLAGAVFLSYASQDAEAAQRISGALKAAGIEVWFDQGDLRGGDAWDQKIRREIRDCALFLPIISANSQARAEGYFRLEWRLADQRTHLMGRSKPFLVPVCVDATPDADADVPDSFPTVQWTRLPGGETPPAFVERIARLLSAASGEARVSRPPPSAPPVAASLPGVARWRLPAVVLMVVALVITVVYVAIDRRRSAQRLSGAAVRGAVVGQAQKSIAVLPFADMSQAKDQEYFSDGLAEELLDKLTKVPGLHVIARTSSFSFKGKSIDIPTIARQLNVVNILQGSVRKVGDRLRVATQLIRAENGEELWSETYDRQLKDVLEVQDEIAGDVVAALKIKLSPAQHAAAAHRTLNPEAYRLYLLGRQFLDGGRVDDFPRAVDACRRAIELDGGYAAAYADLAIALFRVADFAGDRQGPQEAMAAAEKAVLLAPDEAFGYAARGLLRFSDRWDWVGARTDFEKALAIDPGNSRILGQYALMLQTSGRLPEAIAAMRQAAELDPLSSIGWAILGEALVSDRQFAAARDALNRSLALRSESDFSRFSLAQLHLLEGDGEKALSGFQGVHAEQLRLLGAAMAEHSLGHAKESQAILDTILAKYAKTAAFQIAEVYAWQGNKDQAYAWLDRAYEQHDGGLTFMKTDLMLVPLRGDARFVVMLKKIRLSP